MTVDLGNWNINQIVQEMLKPSPQYRTTAQQLFRFTQDKFPIEDYVKPNESHLIQSLKFKKKRGNDKQYLA